MVRMIALFSCPVAHSAGICANYNGGQVNLSIIEPMDDGLVIEHFLLEVLMEW